MQRGMMQTIDDLYSMKLKSLNPSKFKNVNTIFLMFYLNVALLENLIF